MTRTALKNRRQCDVIKFKIDGRNFYVAYSQFADGRPAEIFLDAGRPGSDLKIACIEAATAASLALQHGCSIETLKAAMPRLDGEIWQPAGPLGAALAKVSDAVETDRGI